jgi:hypothetical protein
LCGEAKSKQEEGLQYTPKLLGLAIMPLVELAANPGLQGTMKGMICTQAIADAT